MLPKTSQASDHLILAGWTTGWPLQSHLSFISSHARQRASPVREIGGVPGIGGSPGRSSQELTVRFFSPKAWTSSLVAEDEDVTRKPHHRAHWGHISTEPCSRGASICPQEAFWWYVLQRFGAKELNGAFDPRQHLNLFGSRDADPCQATGPLKACLGCLDAGG